MPYLQEMQTLTFPTKRDIEKSKLISDFIDECKPFIIIEDQTQISINYHTKTLTYNNKEFQLLKIKIDETGTTFDIATDNKIVGYLFIASSDWKINKKHTNFASK